MRSKFGSLLKKPEKDSTRFFLEKRWFLYWLAGTLGIINIAFLKIALDSLFLSVGAILITNLYNWILILKVNKVNKKIRNNGR